MNLRGTAGLPPTPPSTNPSPSRRNEREDRSTSKRRKGSGTFPNASPRPTVPDEACRDHGGPQNVSGLSPLTSITTTSTVHTAHMSNPVISDSSNTRVNHITDFSSCSVLSSVSSLFALTGLTDRSFAKNTPPLTPRALSNDGSQKRTSATSTSNSGYDKERTPNGAQQSRDGSRSSSISPPVRSPKGKLRVRILEGRGLKPSTEPYAVCVFEWNESIAQDSTANGAKSPKNEPSGSGGLLGGLSGLPMKRSGSDMGRSIAIPMKSRQGSTTSLSDQKTFKNMHEVTNPKWDHETML